MAPALVETRDARHVLCEGVQEFASGRQLRTRVHAQKQL